MGMPLVEEVRARSSLPKSIAVGCVSLCVCARVRLFSVNEPS